MGDINISEFLVSIVSAVGIASGYLELRLKSIRELISEKYPTKEEAFKALSEIRRENADLTLEIRVLVEKINNIAETLDVMRRDIGRNVEKVS